MLISLGNHFSRCGLVVAAVLINASFANASLIIDAFNVSQTVGVQPSVGVNTHANKVTDPSLLGGDREFFIERQNPLGTATSVDASLTTYNPAFGVLGLSTRDGQRSRALVTYDGTLGVDSVSTSFAGSPSQYGLDEALGVDADFYSHGAPSLTVTVSSDQGIPLTFTIFSSTGAKWATYLLNVPATPNQTSTIAFSSFTANTGLASDIPVIFSNVGAIQFRLGHNTISSGPTGVDASMSFFAVGVPEPATIALVGFSLLGLGSFARRRQA